MGLPYSETASGEGVSVWCRCGVMHLCPSVVWDHLSSHSTCFRLMLTGEEKEAVRKMALDLSLFLSQVQFCDSTHLDGGHQT